MRIVVLDGCTVNPGDNPWDEIARFGELVVYDRSSPEEVIERGQGADVVLLTNNTPLPAEALRAMPNLRCIGLLATGYNAVDVACAGRMGIPVMNVKGYGSESVAQHAMALLLELCHRPGLHDAAIRAGEWSRCQDFCFWKSPQTDLCGRTIGIVGFGSIGRRVGRLAHAFGMQVAAASLRLDGRAMADRARAEEEARATAARTGQTGPWASEFAPIAVDYPVSYVDLADLWGLSDVVSLHCPLCEGSANLVNAQTLAAFRKGAFLLNLARGALVDERAVADALVGGRLAGFAADVVSVEPIRADNPLLGAPNVVLTPHMAWVSLEARRNVMTQMADNLESWLAGHPNNLVNGPWLVGQGEQKAGEPL